MRFLKIILNFSGWSLVLGFLAAHAAGTPVDTPYHRGELVNSQCAQFLGIPYARVPNRFAKSEPSRTTPYEARTRGKPCMQKLNNIGMPNKRLWTPDGEMTEDCLYLNIWAPYPINTIQLKPVLVWIHSGMFIKGSSSLLMYDGAKLSEQTDSVVVTINYRLGAFGFLYLGTPEAPGNVGIWDQVLALKWIRDYVGTFGGDKDQITLMGKEAGAVSVHMHMLSEHSRLLFHRPVMFDGTAYNWWAVRSKEEMLKSSLELARKTNCFRERHLDIIQCMRGINPTIILDHMSVRSTGFMDFTWSPIYGDEFLPNNPRSINHLVRHDNLMYIQNIYDIIHFATSYNQSLSTLRNVVDDDNDNVRFLNETSFDHLYGNLVPAKYDKYPAVKRFLTQSAVEKDLIDRNLFIGGRMMYMQDYITIVLYSRHHHCDVDQFSEKFKKDASDFGTRIGGFRFFIRFTNVNTTADYGLDEQALFGLPLMTPTQFNAKFGYAGLYSEEHRTLNAELITLISTSRHASVQLVRRWGYGINSLGIHLYIQCSLSKEGIPGLERTMGKMCEMQELCKEYSCGPRPTEYLLNDDCIQYRLSSYFYCIKAVPFVYRELCEENKLEIPTVTVKNGTITGRRNRGIASFVGIPYAQPPVGRKRFEMPTWINELWSTPLRATTLPKACAQPAPKRFQNGKTVGENMWTPKTETSEDCLYLNIWAPMPLDLIKYHLPVIVFIHGGMFEMGSSTAPLFDGSNLARQGRIVVVTINYRLGALGFHCSKFSNDAACNAGLWDQLLALRWIHENIGRFGGEPKKVTLFGQGAGAISVGFHLRSRHSTPYFYRAIMHSPYMHNKWPEAVPLSKAEQRSLALATKAGCRLRSDPMQRKLDAISCLRATRQNLPELAKDTENTVMSFPWGPVSDEALEPEKRFITCPQACDSKPLLIGHNAHETAYFMLQHDGRLLDLFDRSRKDVRVNTDELPGNLRQFYGMELTGYSYSPYIKKFVLAAFDLVTTNKIPRSRPTTMKGRRRYVDFIYGTEYFTCASEKFATEYGDGITSNVYYYHFNQRSSVRAWPEVDGVMHGDELRYIFGEPFLSLAELRERGYDREYTQDEKRLSQAMIKQWVAFSDNKLENWPSYTRHDQTYIEFKVNQNELQRVVRAQDDESKRITCDTWTEVPKILQQIERQLCDQTYGPTALTACTILECTDQPRIEEHKLQFRSICKSQLTPRRWESKFEHLARLCDDIPYDDICRMCDSFYGPAAKAAAIAKCHRDNFLTTPKPTTTPQTNTVPKITAPKITRPPETPYSPPIATVANGTLAGYLRDGIARFPGIAYAQIPTRFAKPASLTARWAGNRLSVNRPACIQANYMNPDGSTVPSYLLQLPLRPTNTGPLPDGPIRGVREDCLYLNIRAPWPKPTADKLPVMVWIHGGGYISGSSTQHLYDGTQLSRKGNVIVVSVNYRLGPFGFFYLGTDAAPGNIGLWDQSIALKWIHENIHAFGGDPQKITLFGQGTGASSVNMHILSSKSNSYFQQAILQSGTVFNTWASHTKKEMLDRSLKLAVAVNCHQKERVPNFDNIATCMQNVDAKELVRNMWLDFNAPTSKFKFDFVWTPLIGDEFLPRDPAVLINELREPKKILLGVNSNEIDLILKDAWPPTKGPYESVTPAVTAYMEFKPPMPGPAFFIEMTPWEQYLVWNPGTYGSSARVLNYVAELHRPRGYELDGSFRIVNDMFNDLHFICGISAFAVAYANKFPNSVYSYYFNHKSSMSRASRGAAHGAEMSYVFGEPLLSLRELRENGYTNFFSEQEKELSKNIMMHWSKFAASGNPSTSAENPWPFYSNTSKSYMELNLATSAPSSDDKFSRSKECYFWREFLPLVNKQWEYRCHWWKYCFEKWNPTNPACSLNTVPRGGPFSHMFTYPCEKDGRNNDFWWLCSKGGNATDENGLCGDSTWSPSTPTPPEPTGSGCVMLPKPTKIMQEAAAFVYVLQLTMGNNRLIINRHAYNILLPRFAPLLEAIVMTGDSLKWAMTHCQSSDTTRALFQQLIATFQQLMNELDRLETMANQLNLQLHAEHQRANEGLRRVHNSFKAFLETPATSTNDAFIDVCNEGDYHMRFMSFDAFLTTRTSAVTDKVYSVFDNSIEVNRQLSAQAIRVRGHAYTFQALQSIVRGSMLYGICYGMGMFRPQLYRPHPLNFPTARSAFDEILTKQIWIEANYKLKTGIFKPDKDGVTPLNPFPTTQKAATTTPRATAV